MHGNPTSLADPTGLFSASPATIERALARAGLAETAGFGPEDPFADIAALAALAYTVFADEPAANDRNYDNCPSDDSYCKYKQQQLLTTRMRLSAMLANGIMPPFQYAQAAKLFNNNVAKHNDECPQNQVAPLPLGGGSF